MKKIMFNDKYGLTQAVLAKRKTQTRRIIPSADPYNRRYEGTLKVRNKLGQIGLLALFNDVRIFPAYYIGEEVAISQSYRDILEKSPKANELKELPGYRNKMFVRADLMPHHIRITDIRVERLQDISDKDCLAEGIYRLKNIATNGWKYSYRSIWRDLDIRDLFTTPKSAYAALIDKVCGKGTWDANTYVFVYEFELND
jgi:hypothetical protein|nr:MAG TPA: ASCH domain protein [Caudoviricetes sp.]